jgi:hypothetical protein
MGYPVREEDTHLGLLRKLERDADAGREQLEIVDRCCRYYIEQGVIVDGIGQALHEACASCVECWATVPPTAYPKPEDSAISVPWVGPDYFEHRLCAVGINQHSYGGLGGPWWIARGAIEDLQDGHIGKRRFHFQVGRYMAVLLAALDAKRIPADDGLDSAAAATAWSRCAFHEAVKCAPTENVSKPPEAMWHNCPPRYLHAELRILAPTTILAIGRDTWTAVKGVGAVENIDDGQSSAFWRGVTELDGGRVEIFFVHHPSRENWRRSLPELVTSLRTRPPHSA